MHYRSLRHPFLKNWLKALFLSPGILFITAYLAIYQATAMKADQAIRLEAERLAFLMTDQRITLSTASSRPNLGLDSLTIRQVTIKDNDNPDRQVHFKKVTLPCKELQMLFLERSAAEKAALSTCRELLALSGSLSRAGSSESKPASRQDWQAGKDSGPMTSKP